jgi:hypothetical protein
MVDDANKMAAILRRRMKRRKGRERSEGERERE